MINMEAKIITEKEKSLSIIQKSMDAVEHKGIAVDFLLRIVKGDIKSAYEQHVGQGFRHHNAYYKSDGASLMQAMEANAKENPNKSLEIIHVVADGDMVAVHSFVKQHSNDLGAVVVHFFRFKRMKIIELWDVGMPVPEDMENELGMI